MKNTVFAILGIIIFTIVVVSLVSCRKIYRCECEIIKNGINQNFEFEMLKVNKGDGKKICKEQEYYLQNADSISFAECTFNTH
jgi:hypothetical protein